VVSDIDGIADSDSRGKSEWKVAGVKGTRKAEVRVPSGKEKERRRKTVDGAKRTTGHRGRQKTEGGQEDSRNRAAEKSSSRAGQGRIFEDGGRRVTIASAKQGRHHSQWLPQFCKGLVCGTQA
jgi:hypothetical protein